MKIFLTGGTGFIGQSLTQKLIAQGWTVDALVRNPDSAAARHLQALGARLVQGDILDVASMRPAMQGADWVIHNAGMYELGLDKAGRQRMYDINVHGTDNVLGLAHELQIARTLYVSSVAYLGGTGDEVFDENSARKDTYRSWYEQTKTEAHEVALAYREKGLPLNIVCPCQVIGPNDHSAFGYFIRMYLNRLMPPFAWLPDVQFTFVHVDDLTAGFVLAIQKARAGETYLFTGATQPKRDYLKSWTPFPGGYFRSVYIPAWLAKILFAPMPLLLRAAGLPVFISPETVSADVDIRISSAKAQRELGWTFRSADAMWADTLTCEVKLLEQRRGQSLLQRLKPLE